MSRRFTAIALAYALATVPLSPAAIGAEFELTVGAAPVTAIQFGGNTWSYCSSEDQFCAVPYPTTVRFGTDGQYYSLQVTGGVQCSNQVFGDPRRGRGKHCDFLTASYGPGAPVVQPQFCANEGGYCNFRGTARVIYGVDSRVTSRFATNGIPCTNAYFGDPAVGQGKACYVVP